MKFQTLVDNSEQKLLVRLLLISRYIRTCPNEQTFKTKCIMGTRRDNRAINYWSKADDAGWFVLGGVAIPIIFVWTVVRSTGAAHSGLPANTRRNADLFAGWVLRLGPSVYALLKHGRLISTSTRRTVFKPYRDGQSYKVPLTLWNARIVSRTAPIPATRSA